MERWRGRVAVVTGASAGIGAAIAYQFQDAGLTVVALARRKEKIPVAVAKAREEAAARGRASLGKAPAPGPLHCVQCDVSNEQDVLAAFKWVRDNVGTVHILVNNAGRGGETRLTGTNTAEWRDILDTNVLGLSMCTREAIQLMREKGVDDGHVVHIGSIAGHIYPVIPGAEIYGATKHAVRVLTEGLRKELVAAKSKIRVTEVSPGVVKTEFVDKLKSRGGDDWWKKPHLHPEDIADCVLYAINAPPHVQIHEIIVKPVGEAF
ncbi:hypothetical protein R5R35_009521 [Gryllus longicercus]|uniref:Uncharacterized protein n=1 Tax=Gryllus longicercus TaxID=2509291 RepID=A0AAN9VVW0_9ORTH